jgi:hypothetical protein
MAIFNTAFDANELEMLMNKGLSGYLSVHPVEKLTVIWGKLKAD